MENNGLKSPLADRMRPETLEEYVGQQHIIGEGKLLRNAIESDNLPSMVFWGPPGSGKTTLARIIAHTTNSEFKQVSAIDTGVKDIRAIVADAQGLKRLGTNTVLFIDEIHRYNKSQQDALLPHVENGTFVLIGATTENPSFEMNSALLSRSRVFVLNMLEKEDLIILIKRAIDDSKKGLGAFNIKLKDEVMEFLAGIANGDARTVLNALELAATATVSNKKGETVITIDAIKEALQKTHLLYDKNGEEHFNIISALHKSMRGGDANAALYWLGRMLEGGEQPLYIARRIIRFASEDIGLANSFALPQAVAAYQACHLIGMPECEVNLAQAVVYMAKSKKEQ